MKHAICLLQSWPSDVVLNWVRAIDRFTAGDTTPLNVTNIDTAEIISTLQARPSYAHNA